MEKRKMEKSNRSTLGNEEENQSNARMFASSSNLTGTNNAKKEDDKTQKQHLDIIKNILEMFNIEDTKSKYESQNVVEFVLDPNDFGYDCSLSTARVRQRLCDLMGTDVIRLNDKQYFQKLSERLEEEYDTIMDKQEEARAASEKQRLRRLMLEGVIDATNDYRAVIQGDHKPIKKKKKKKRKIKRMTAEGTVTPGYDEGNTTMTSHASDNEDESIEKKNEVVTQVEIISGSRPSSSVSQKKRRTPTHKGGQSFDNANNDIENGGQSQSIKEMHARPPHHESALRSSSSCSTHRKKSRVKSAAARLTRREKDEQSDDSDLDQSETRYDTQSLPGREYTRTPSKYSKHEPERVRHLRMEESVAGLYSLADELILTAKADAKTEKRGQKKPF